MMQVNDVNETYAGQKNMCMDSCAYRISDPNASPNFAGTVTTCHMGFSDAAATARHSDRPPSLNSVLPMSTSGLPTKNI